MNITCLVFGILFLAAGMVFYIGKGHSHMTAWKNLPEEEKAAIRIKPLCRNIGGMITLCGLIFLISGLWSGFKDTAFVWCMIAWLVLSGLDVYYIEKKGRYQVK